MTGHLIGTTAGAGAPAAQASDFVSLFKPGPCRSCCSQASPGSASRPEDPSAARSRRADLHRSGRGGVGGDQHVVRTGHRSADGPDPASPPADGAIILKDILTYEGAFRAFEQKRADKVRRAAYNYYNHAELRVAARRDQWPERAPRVAFGVASARTNGSGGTTMANEKSIADAGTY